MIQHNHQEKQRWQTPAPEDLLEASSHSEDILSKEALPGRKIGRYLIQERLGQGGMAKVYKVWNEGLEKSYALKLLPPGASVDEETFQRFQREIKVLAKLDHPAIVSVVDSGTWSGLPYFVMELIEGKSFAQVVEEQGPLSEEQAVHLMIQISQGIQHLHGQDIIHRDIKPSNCMLRSDGLALLTDFGLAQNLSDKGLELTQTGVQAGTPAFMSPEQARAEKKEIGPASDIYQLGATLFTLLAGRPPFQAEHAHEMIRKISQANAPRFSGVEISKPLRAIILKAMAPLPQNRYQSAQGFIQDLKRMLQGEWVLARGKNPVGRIFFFTRKYALVLLIVCLGVAVTFSVMTMKPFEQPQQKFPVLNSNLFNNQLEGLEKGIQLLALEGAVVRKEAGRMVLRSTAHPPRLGAILSAFPNSSERSAQAIPKPLELGWGDFSASFEVRFPEDPEKNNGSFSCFFGAHPKDPYAGLVVEYLPENQRLRFIQKHQEQANFATLPLGPDEPFVLQITKHFGWIEVNCPLLSGQKRRSFYQRPESLPFERNFKEFQVGLIAERTSLVVEEINYQQLNEEEDIATLLFNSGHFDQALVRIRARLGSYGTTLTKQERQKLEFMQGMCLKYKSMPAFHDKTWLQKQGFLELSNEEFPETNEVRTKWELGSLESFERASEGPNRDIRFYAFSELLHLHLKNRLKAYEKGGASSQLVLPQDLLPQATIRSLRDEARKTLRESELVCRLNLEAKILLQPLMDEKENASLPEGAAFLRREMALACFQAAAEEAYQDAYLCLQAYENQIEALSQTQKYFPFKNAEAKNAEEKIDLLLQELVSRPSLAKASLTYFLLAERILGLKLLHSPLEFNTYRDFIKELLQLSVASLPQAKVQKSLLRLEVFQFYSDLAQTQSVNERTLLRFKSFEQKTELLPQKTRLWLGYLRTLFSEAQSADSAELALELTQRSSTLVQELEPWLLGYVPVEAWDLLLSAQVRSFDGNHKAAGELLSQAQAIAKGGSWLADYAAHLSVKE